MRVVLQRVRKAKVKIEETQGDEIGQGILVLLGIEKTDDIEDVDWLVNKKHKKVYVCGLDGDFGRKKFGSILDIIPLADEVKKVNGICHNCKKRKSAKPLKNTT